MAHIINKQVLDQFNILILSKDLKTIQNLFSWKTCQIIFENFSSFAIFDDVSKKAKIRSMLLEFLHCFLQILNIMSILA